MQWKRRCISTAEMNRKKKNWNFVKISFMFLMLLLLLLLLHASYRSRYNERASVHWIGAARLSWLGFYNELLWMRFVDQTHECWKGEHTTHERRKRNSYTYTHTLSHEHKKNTTAALDKLFIFRHYFHSNTLCQHKISIACILTVKN